MQENTVRDERSNAPSLNRLRPSALLKRDSDRANAMNTVDAVLESDRNIIFLEVATDSGGSAAVLPAYNEARRFCSLLWFSYFIDFLLYDLLDVVGKEKKIRKFYDFNPWAIVDENLHLFFLNLARGSIFQ